MEKVVKFNNDCNEVANIIDKIPFIEKVDNFMDNNKPVCYGGIIATILSTGYFIHYLRKPEVVNTL